MASDAGRRMDTSDTGKKAADYSFWRAFHVHDPCTAPGELGRQWKRPMGGREREGERREKRREKKRSVNILVHSCSDATSRELRRIPHVFELPGYAQDALGGLFRVGECLYK